MELPPPKLDANGTYNAYVFAEAVRNVVNERIHGTPTFVYAAFQSVHEPLQAPDEAIARYSEALGKHRRIYAAMVSVLDEAVGMVEKSYKDAGIWEQTITIFTTDNGGWLSFGGLKLSNKVHTNKLAV